MIKAKRFSNQTKKFRKNYFESESWQRNQVVCGIDEVGRGCLAGPLVTAAVILPLGKTPSFLKDSKVMAPEERLKASIWIKKHCFYSYGIVHHRIIDTHNIWHATLIAMKKALLHLLAYSPRPEAVLVDAMPLQLIDTSYNDIPVHYFPQGERRSSSIAAASIIAKVKRDALMEVYSQIVPGYLFEQHKGYATQKHRESLEIRRHSIIHRKTFLKNDILPESFNERIEQQTIF